MGNLFIKGIKELRDKLIDTSRRNKLYNAQQNAQQNAQEIMNEIVKNRYITIKQLSAICKLGTRTVQKIINELREQNKIKRVGANKGGYWEVNV